MVMPGRNTFHKRERRSTTCVCGPGVAAKFGVSAIPSAPEDNQFGGATEPVMRLAHASGTQATWQGCSSRQSLGSDLTESIG